MSSQSTAPSGAGAPHRVAPGPSDAANAAYRRAWWSLALYPFTFAAAFVVGEGILSALTGDTGDIGDTAFWQVIVAATPALVVFVVPGVLAVVQGRTAMRLGREDGKVPAIVGAALALGFVGLNAASYLLGLLVG